jgi:hypothetical protein
MVFAAAMLRVIDADKNASNNDRTSSLAITITELFRRYPSLSSFLPAVMKRCLTDTGVNSQIFPILLLLSRVQPVAISGGMATSLTEPFPPIILESLGNRHHAIRAAAARSLANLCSEVQKSNSSSTALLEHCKSMLEKSLTTPKDWNVVDGALLAINTLVRSSSASKNAFREMEIEPILFRIVSLDKNAVSCPPCCIATALECLVTISSYFNDSENRAMVTASCQAILCLKEIGELIGGAKLYATAASSLCTLLQLDLWRPIDACEFKKSLSALMDLISCSLIDVRLAAVKLFKKGIYQQIDQLLDQDNGGSGRTVPETEILSSISKVLLQSLRAELDLGKHSDDNIGAHAPTVRRISRCLVECFNGYMALSDEDTKALPSFLPQEDFLLLWPTALEMTEFESFLSDSLGESNGETFLSANAAELMSIAIVRGLIEGESAGRVDVFVKIVKRLNDPHASWRSHYSAAVSIETSQILNPEMRFENKNTLSKSVLFEVLGLLQDSDPDVRRAAVRAASQVGNTTGSSDAFPSLLPELALQQTYLKVYEIGCSDKDENKVAIVDALLTTILENCGNILTAMARLEEELQITREGSTSAASLLNVATTRKIFEAEDPNPFYERVMANQLATQSLLELGSWSDESSKQDELLALCTSCLEVICKNMNEGGMAHDITRFPSTFSSLHGLISGVAAVLYLGAKDGRGVDVSAEAIVDAVQSEESSSIHPDILSALKCLVRAGDGDHNTKETIQRGMFLLR